MLLCAFAILHNACNAIEKPPSFFVKNTDSLLSKTDHGWFYRERLFSGYMIEVENNGQVVYSLPIVQGKEHGRAVGYYNSGAKLLERPFVHGKREGVFKQWWPNGRMRYLFTYKRDKYEGRQTVYFHFGQVQEEKNYVEGLEEGVQRIWDSNGKLISNYTVKNKIVYGAISAKDCMPAYP